MKKTEGTLKSKKPRALLKKLGAFLAIAGIGVASALGFVGCVDSSSPTPTPTPTPGPGPVVPPVTITMTFDDFINDHSSDAVRFFEDNIRPAVVENKDVKAENWHLNDKDGDNKVESASMSFVYSLNDTERAVQVANVTFNPVDVQDIVDGKVTSVNTTVSREDVFTFDAKVNYQNQDLATALYNAANINSDTKLFQDTGIGNSIRQFIVLDMSDTDIKLSYVASNAGDGSIDAFLENLAKNPMVATKSETKLDGATLYSTGYTLEKFEETEKPGPGPEIPPETNITNAEIISALEENCIDGIVDATFIGGLKQNKEKITDGTWYLTTNTDGNITKAEYAYTYQLSSDSSYYVITEVNFSSPLTADNIKDGDINGIANNTYTSKGYKLSIQDTNAELTQAICDKAFGESNTATRYIIEGVDGNDSQLGITHSFTVIQIEDGNVKEATIIIKNDSAGYVANINNGKHKDVTYGKSYELSGEKVSVEANDNTQESNYRYAVEFGDDELYYL